MKDNERRLAEMGTFDYPIYPFRRHPDHDSPEPVRHPVVIVGAGPVGLTGALELARHGVAVVVLDDDDTVSVGSRAICWSKRSLEIFDRFGLAEPIIDRGVTWNTGRVFFGERELYRFTLSAEGTEKHPAFVNLAQYRVEQALVERIAAEPLVELRWQSRVTGCQPGGDCVRLDVTTPEGDDTVLADYVVAADGARSALRRQLGLDFVGQTFTDNFLICDIRMQADHPAERLFWFEPPFDTRQALMHKQGDGIWRLDFQLGPDIDRDAELAPERLRRRVRLMLRDDREFEFEWTSIYTFQCRRLERFRHGLVVFAGDAAHQVAPFGARGANGGLQDVDNLMWKLALVVQGRAPSSLLDSYDAERIPAADENIAAATSTAEFMSPAGRWSRLRRDAILRAARHSPRARRLVNSGRMSVPAVLSSSPLSTPPEPPASGVPNGAVCPDLPVGTAEGRAHLLGQLAVGVRLLWFTDGGLPPAELGGLRTGGVEVHPLVIGPRHLSGGLPCVSDPTGAVRTRFAAAPGTTYLVRPDDHVAARWSRFDPGAVIAAVNRVIGRDRPAAASSDPAASSAPSG